MKAWIVREKDEFASTVVFAETCSKAKSAAMKTDCCEDVPYINIEARRCPKADSQYTEGKTEMNWNDPKDRLFLVKELGFYCEYVEPYCCEKCSAKECCDPYQDMLEECENNETREDYTNV